MQRFHRRRTLTGAFVDLQAEQAAHRSPAGNQWGHKRRNPDVQHKHQHKHSDGRGLWNHYRRQQQGSDRSAAHHRRGNQHQHSDERGVHRHHHGGHPGRWHNACRLHCLLRHFWHLGHCQRTAQQILTPGWARHFFSKAVTSHRSKSSAPEDRTKELSSVL